MLNFEICDDNRIAEIMKLYPGFEPTKVDGVYIDPTQGKVFIQTGRGQGVLMQIPEAE